MHSCKSREIFFWSALPRRRCSTCGIRKSVSWMLVVSKYWYLCQCVKSIWAVKLCMSPPFSKCSISLLLLHNTFTPHSFVLTFASDCDLRDMWFICSLLSTSVRKVGSSFILNINHYNEINPYVPRAFWQLPWGQYCPWEQLFITESGGTIFKHSHVPPQTVLCPGFLAAETWHDPGWMLLSFVPPRIRSNQHSWLGADEHLSMHLSALQRMRPWSRNLISKYSTQGRHCCMAGQAVSLEMACSTSSNVAPALGTATSIWRCLHLSSSKGRKLQQPVQNGLQPANFINQFELFFSHSSIMYCYLWHENFFKAGDILNILLCLNHNKLISELNGY